MDNGFFEKSGNGFWKKFIASGFTAIFTAGLFGSNAGKVVAVKEMESIQDQKILVGANDKDWFEKEKAQKGGLTPLDDFWAFIESISKEDREKAKLSPKENLLVVLITIFIVASIVIPLIVFCSKSEDESADEKIAEPVAKPESSNSPNSRIS